MNPETLELKEPSAPKPREPQVLKKPCEPSILNPKP